LTDEASGNPNVAATRRFIDAYNEGDLDSLVALADPNIEWEVAPEHPAATTHRGIDAVREYHEDWRNTLRDLRVDLRSIAASGDTVVTVCGVRGEGAESGADVEVEIALLTTFRDGRAVRVEEFLDPDEAMRALESDDRGRAAPNG
jgi:ketosteroid isomerase-like protein